MYLGKIMELADRDVLYSEPLHPYTHALMSAVPVPDPAKEARRHRILLVGDLPSPINPPTGCVFHTRCPKFRELLDDSQRAQCQTAIPLVEEKSPGHFAACHFPEARADIAAAEDLGVAADASLTAAQAAQAAHPPSGGGLPPNPGPVVDNPES
jgi:oligopeptide/dipeptide ABC transporter ATP-binding protein